MAVMKASMKTMKAMKTMKKLCRSQKTSKADRGFKNEVTKLREENAALKAELQRERGTRLDFLLRMIAQEREQERARNHCPSGMVCPQE